MGPLSGPVFFVEDHQAFQMPRDEIVSRLTPRNLETESIPPPLPSRETRICSSVRGAWALRVMITP